MPAGLQAASLEVASFAAASLEAASLEVLRSSLEEALVEQTGAVGWPRGHRIRINFGKTNSNPVSPGVGRVPAGIQAASLELASFAAASLEAASLEVASFAAASLEAASLAPSRRPRSSRLGPWAGPGDTGFK